MRVPLSWLREFVDVDLEPEALAERLTLLGMEVKGIDRIGVDWRSVVSGELLDVVPHPTSDRLSLTTVRVGDGPTLSIVCGATNIVPGQRVPVALPGAVLPGDRRIEVTRIAGTESQGMLCSGDELGLTPDAEGILILPEATPLGRSLDELFGDVVLDIDVKPNRGDALSVLGLAREVSAATGAPVRMPTSPVPESGDATRDHVSVEVRDIIRCPRFVARYVDGVAVGPSPLAVQLRLSASGIRPVSNVVDASNHVMLELGKPVHTFDAGAVTDGRLIVRAAEPGEHLETLDHVARVLDPSVLVIADPVRALAMAGVMGGASSEVGEATTSVIVESAIFDPVTIRRTAQRYALRSEASLRFEKGQEWRLARAGADRTAQLIVAWAGGRAAVGAVDTDPLDPPLARVPFRPRRLSRLLGMELETEVVRATLARVGVATESATDDDVVPIGDGGRGVPLDAVAASEALVAIVPPHRRDLVIEADVAEEVARVRGYDAVPSVVPATGMPAYRPDPRRALDLVRDLLSGRGLVEVLTHALIAPEAHRRLGFGPDDGLTIRVANPVSADHSELRRSLLPEHLRVLVDNERQRRSDVAIFEIGTLHERSDGGPVERRELGLLLAGTAAPTAWDVPARAVDAGDAKGLLDWLAERLGAERLTYRPVVARDGVDHPGRTAAVIGKTASGHAVELGRVGELDPRYLDAVDARSEHVVFASVDLDGLLRLRPARVRVGSLPRLPGIERDIAVVADRDRAAGEIEAAILGAGGPLLSSVRLFDRYEGPPLGDSEVSLAYRLRFEPGDRVIADEELERLVGGIVDALRERTGARLRS